MSTWLTKGERERLVGAETLGPRSPIPTQTVSNGEYLPSAQSPAQRRVEAVLDGLATANGRRLGMGRRQFLRSATGMAAAFLAMNEVYGRLFTVSEAEASEPGTAQTRLASLAGQFVFDVQLHFVRDDYGFEGLLGLRENAKRWNPALAGEEVTFEDLQFENFIKEVYLDSETKLGLLSGAPSDESKNWFLTNDQIARAREVVNAVAGSRRLQRVRDEPDAALGLAAQSAVRPLPAMTLDRRRLHRPPWSTSRARPRGSGGLAGEPGYERRPGTAS